MKGFIILFYKTLCMVSIPFTLTTVKTVFWRGFYMLALLYRKNVVRAAALYTTFSQTLRSGLLAVNGENSWMTVGQVFLDEGFNKFLGAAPNILQGLNNLSSGNFIQGLKLLWIGVASVYMMLWLWNGFRGRIQNTEVDDVETVLILVIWVLASSQIHGSQLLVEIVNQASSLADQLAGFIPSSGNVTGVNESLNASEEVLSNSS